MVMAGTKNKLRSTNPWSGINTWSSFAELQEDTWVL